MPAVCVRQMRMVVGQGLAPVPPGMRRRPRDGIQAVISFMSNTRSASHTRAMATIALEPPNSTTRR